ncbi:tRNA (adenosine(37)-N6)-threonylcarbamoyltransferase complex transferase subunit TsaD [Candidatus Viridilinea mediisalina]|uniref:tRNA N6-adenosine threonylcarbamoyltransferase n=1 Tax=Candidatus Viridilinea mediisalina TaxID=2024553 RepID=A0A2A6RIY4_9CHLR|nr:tRNA (adenosine(37)-N6)-threonylcarbamoyltransferase complex transferase subunit TsaD [Candidatus Viridilinea mediisalina]PDW03084.1 tRNA (adenosine(37)-N6)-threonylcarbamoyltransferase complex transferase subunit TsaD [Candidatus Viridilinea mediisalina]
MNVLPEDFTILALETSCDETAAAVVRGGRTMLSNVVASQMELHQRFGGVVPEVASRQHMLSLVPVVNEALRAVPEGWDGIHAIAATCGPGLSGALLTGLNAAKAMAWQRNLPFIPVNHLDAHIYASWIKTENGKQQTNGERRLKSLKRSEPEPGNGSDEPPFPLVALIVSGGHTILALLRDHGDYQLLGQTRDDAVGEAFDKVARILGLGYPGGPALQQAALGATPAGVLPRAWLRDSFDFSFSGLKTAVLHKVQERQDLSERLPRQGASERRQGGRAVPPATNPPPPPAPEPAQQPTVSLDSTFVAQMAHAFQESVVDVLTTKAVEAAARYNAAAIILAGGVAANLRLREELTRRATVPVRCPPLALCTDNAAMVAAAAFYRYDADSTNVWATDVNPSLKL